MDAGDDTLDDVTQQAHALDVQLQLIAVAALLDDPFDEDEEPLLAVLRVAHVVPTKQRDRARALCILDRDAGIGVAALGRADEDVRHHTAEGDLTAFAESLWVIHHLRVDGAVALEEYAVGVKWIA